jgi:hypothetical protein
VMVAAALSLQAEDRDRLRRRERGTSQLAGGRPLSAGS